MQITEALQQAIERFSAFQSGGQRHHYPRHLKLAVISLMTHYPLEFLSGHLSVSIATLRKWKSNHQSVQESVQVFEHQFVPLELERAEPVSHPSSQHCAQPMEMDGLTVCLPNGLSLQLPKQALKQTTQFLHALVKEFDACSI